MTGLYILLTALLIDVAFVEMPNRFHPVAWLGKFINLQLRIKPQGKRYQLIFGTALVIMTTGIITTLLVLLSIYLQQVSYIAYIIIASYLLKNTFSLRGLWQAVEKVKINLAEEHVAAAKSDVTALVHRDPANLSKTQIISATIESCAENLCDSFVAPLFYFVFFGLPGAVAYRIANTFDAMIGYHDKYEYTGKFAAHFDDVLNYIPARLSGIFIILSAAICGNNAAAGWRNMLGQHKRTESPNAGWTMSAMAGSLGIMLEKTGHYRLGITDDEPSLVSVGKSQSILLVAAFMWSLIIVVKEVFVAATA